MDLTEGVHLVRFVQREPAVADADGEILATVFYDAPLPPLGFTAFEEAAARRSGP